MNMIKEDTTSSTPKVFISYSHDYQEKVKEYVDRLITEGGVDVKVDFYDLDKGHDLNAYMEAMVNDTSIEFVLMFCTRTYTEKANSRKGGVGTESLIISQEVYGNITQTKFIPIACEVDEQGSFTLPTFVKSRNSFNFTTPEKLNEEWENLIRFIHNKPRYQKPKIGTPPRYIPGPFWFSVNQYAMVTVACGVFLNRWKFCVRSVFSSSAYSDKHSKNIRTSSENCLNVG